ncbi:unnamed protein product, partial [Allacma fusca]
MNVRTIQ